MALSELLDEEPEHSAHVARLALELFDALAPLHRLDDGAREYLEAAALLANVGLFIAHSRHHLHSYYVIRNSERLLGFTDTEIEMIALIARYHRKSAPKASHPDFARLAARRAGPRAHAGRHPARRHRARPGPRRPGRRRGRAHRGVGRQHRGHRRPRVRRRPRVELYAAGERRALLEEVLGRTVTVTAA